MDEHTVVGRTLDTDVNGLLQSRNELGVSGFRRIATADSDPGTAE
jgi:hypothetical protein